MTRTAIVDDHQLLSGALAMALRLEGHEVLVPELGTLAGVREALAGFGPQVALLDVDLGHVGSGRDLVTELAASGCRTVIVSGTADGWVIGECLELGATGWVPKGAAFDELLGAVLDAAEGRTNLSVGAREDLLAAWRDWRAQQARTEERFRHLTHREAEVLASLMDGLSVDRIAARAFVSTTTVRSQVKSILSKLGINSQLEAVALAVRSGWGANTK